MNIPKLSLFNVKKPVKIISENGPQGSGEVICNCNTQFQHSLLSNMGEYEGFIFPVCPNCKCIPESETRRIDL